MQLQGMKYLINCLISGKYASWSCFVGVFCCQTNVRNIYVALLSDSFFSQHLFSARQHFYLHHHGRSERGRTRE